MNWIETYEYDAFISHAVEDKMPIANELCSRLEQAGLKIWYSGRELRVGDRLTQTIEEGLSRSRFGIVILSPTYVNKMWTLREFYSLLSREKEGKKIVLPVLYDITPEQLAQKDLTMAEMFSLRADKGIDHVVNVLTSEIKKLKREDVKKNVSSWLTLKTWFSFLFFIAFIVAATFSFKQITQSESPEELLQQRIMAHISNREPGGWPSFKKDDAFSSAVQVNEVTEKFVRYDNVGTYSRQEFSITRSDLKSESQRERNVFSSSVYDSMGIATDLLKHEERASAASGICRCNHSLHLTADHSNLSSLPAMADLANSNQYYMTTKSVEVVFAVPQRQTKSDNSVRKDVPVTFHSLLAE
jgi:hypothetical protein